MKTEATQQSDSVLEVEKKMKEKEQAISELGMLVKKQQEQMTTNDEMLKEKENQIVGVRCI